MPIVDCLRSALSLDESALKTTATPPVWTPSPQTPIPSLRSIIMSDFQIDPNHIIRSPYTECSIPDTDLYTFVFHREQVGNFPPEGPKDRIVFIDGPTGKKITFSDLHDRVKLLSRGFAQAMGIQCRDSVCFYMPNHVFLFPLTLQLTYLDGLSHCLMGCLPVRRCTILRQPHIHGYRASASTETFKIKVHSNASRSRQVGAGRSEASRHPGVAHFPC